MQIEKRMRKAVILLTILIVVFSPLFSQQEGEKNDTIPKVKLTELSFDIIFPIGDFDKKLDRTPVGFSTRFFWQAKPAKPIFLGFEMNYTQLYSISEEYIDFIDGFQVDLRQSVKSHLVGIHFLFRYYPSFNIPYVEPYIEGMAGTKIPFASDVIRDIETGESLEFEFTDGDIGLSYGLAAGLQTNLKDGIWYLNARVSYESGPSTGFLGLNPTDSTSLFDLETRNAALQFIRYQIGFTFAF